MIEPPQLSLALKTSTTLLSVIPIHLLNLLTSSQKTRLPNIQIYQSYALYSMAEVLGVVAGGIGIVSLAIQIVENLNKVIRFCESIKEAPTDIQRIIKELQLLSDIMSTLQLVHGKRRGTGQAMTKNCLDLVTHDISKLSDLSSYLEQRLNSNKIITRTWARVRTVFSEKKIAMLRDHLESATSRLQLLQSCHMLSVKSLNS